MSSYTGAALLGLLFFAVIVIIIQVIIIRWVFRIDRQVSNQNAMVWLLIKLCEKQGVSPEDIHIIMSNNRIK